jgi:hypothetical protein
VSIAAMLVIAAAAAACNSSDLLDVQTPATVPVDMLNDPKNATLMVNSAVADFECALGSTIAVEGIISDELADAQLGAAAWPYDRRDANTQPGGSYGVNPCTNNQTPGIYTPLATARWDADTAITKLNTWTDAEVPNRQALIAKAAVYAGFSFALGQSMCEAAFDLGPQVNQAAMFALAEERFTTAMTAQATNQTNLSTPRAWAVREYGYSRATRQALRRMRSWCRRGSCSWRGTTRQTTGSTTGCMPSRSSSASTQSNRCRATSGRRRASWTRAPRRS